MSRERASHVPPPLVPWQACLARDAPAPCHKGSHGQLPEQAQLAGEPFGGLVSTAEAAVAVGRDIRDDVCRRWGESLGEEPGGHGGKRAGSALLPAANERAGGVGVHEPRPGGGEGDPPSGALPAPLDRPRRRRAAPGTERRVHRDQPAEAGLAEERPRLSAGDTTRGDEELEEPRRPR